MRIQLFLTTFSILRKVLTTVEKDEQKAKIVIKQLIDIRNSEILNI